MALSAFGVGESVPFDLVAVVRTVAEEPSGAVEWFGVTNNEFGSVRGRGGFEMAGKRRERGGLWRGSGTWSVGEAREF